MLSKQANHALKALLELATEPERWRSTHELAIAQQLPEPMLEQILLRLRRAGLLVARRGRLGGYRLAMPSRDMGIGSVLRAITGSGMGLERYSNCLVSSPTDEVTQGLRRRLELSQLRDLEQLSLEDLLFDLHSATTGTDGEQGILTG